MTQNKALKKIGLIAKELKLPIYVIRLWEKKINILKPIRKPRGTRYFSSSQTELLKEVKYINHDNFYLSGTMIEANSGHITHDFGDTVNNFKEDELLEKYQYLNFYDHQGSHFAPHLVSKSMWNKVGGFSEEFNPGIGSDPDFNMKLWNEGVRIFKGLNDFKVYHFGSITTRKKKNFIKNKGDITFLKKWGITTKFFKKYYLKSRTRFDGPLSDPKINFYFLFDLLICKIKKLFIIN